MALDFREFCPQRYINYAYWILRMAPRFQCDKCLKCFRKETAFRMHQDKDLYGDLCTAYGSRYLNTPPFTTLSMDAKTFMCNFGCSIVTEDKGVIIRHFLESHDEHELQAWCMNVKLMRHSINPAPKSAESAKGAKK